LEVEVKGGRNWIIGSRDHWIPILQAKTDGTLDIHTLSQEDRDALQKFNMPVTIAWISGMLEWGRIGPGDIRCPTLWLAGSKNPSAMSGIREYGATLKGSNIQVQIVEDLDHMQELTEIERVLPLMLTFTRHFRVAAQ
jgi:pimeloyl-ACP methyl ester carboxylesterase